MTIKNRLQKAERTHKESSRAQRGRRLFVYYDGQDFGHLNGVRIPVADFEATRRDGDTALKVQFRDTGAI